MYGTFQKHVADELAGIEAAGLTKHERGIRGPQSAEITADGAEVLNFCANNYLGLADDPRILDAATAALQEWGYGLASVRFICGTQEQHLELERRLAGFLGTEDSILYSSCFDANGESSRRSSALRTLSSRTSSTTRRSSTGSDSRRLVGSATATGTWRISRPSCRRHPMRASG